MGYKVTNMSDSDSDAFSNNVFAYQSQSTRICAKGPNVNTTSRSFRNNMLTSLMNMPSNMERPRYAESVYDHRSTHRMRETSPMSVHSAMYDHKSMYHRRDKSSMSFHSASGIQSRNLHHSHYPGGMSSQRSMYNGRSGSPMSVRTIDSITTITATDIASALKTNKYNKYQMSMIQNAYKKCIKGKIRKRNDKKRKLRLFLKGFRRKSGGDSGDQASESSLSSDDHRSVNSSRNAIFNDNASCKSTRTEFMDFRKSMKESSMYRDCTHDLRQNHFHNILLVPSGNMKENPQPRLNNTSLKSLNSRLTSGFLLPSQRFNANQSVASLSIPEMSCPGPQRINSQAKNGTNKRNQNGFHQNREHAMVPSQGLDSEQEEIFSEITMMQNNNQNNSQCKRRLVEKDITLSHRKKSKLSTPVKKFVKPKTPKSKQTINKLENEGKGNNFVFAKPQLPVKRPASVKNLIVKSQKVSTGQSKTQKTKIIVTKPQQQDTLVLESQDPVEEIISQSHPSKETVSHSPEKFISKSAQPLDLEQQKTTLYLPQNNHKDQHDMTHSNTDMSMRPSFIKRKLFTQKVDEAEKSESSESLQADSPQSNIYSKIQKEKNKARKLVTQSCLSRDLGDDSNLLDLIHKIVPPDCMNVTTATNKIDIQGNKSKPANSDKWDISTIITTDNNEQLSDTYTDDEIFKSDETKQYHAKKQNDVKKDNKKVLQKNTEKAETNKKTDKTEIKNRPQSCQKTLSSPKVVLQKISPQITVQKNNEPTLHVDSNGFNKKKVYCVKSFWDDIGSDYEVTPIKKPELKGKGLSNMNAVTHSVSNQVKSPQIVTPISQPVANKTSLASNKVVHTVQSKNNKTAAKPTPNDTKINKNKTHTKILKVNKYTLRIRSQRTSKINNYCTDHKLDDTVNTSNEPRLYRTLRSRDIDLSTSLDKDKSIAQSKKTAVKNKKNPVKNKTVAKLSDKENILKTCDQSFTLSSETPLASKRAANKRVSKIKIKKNNETKSRQSDVSFTLGEKSLNRTMTTRRRLKEVEKLQLTTLTLFNNGKKSPLSKRDECTSLYKSRTSARLSKSKVY